MKILFEWPLKTDFTVLSSADSLCEYTEQKKKCPFGGSPVCKGLKFQNCITLNPEHRKNIF